MIEARFNTFATQVRQEHFGFRPNHHWWLIKHNKESQRKFPNSIPILEQLCITDRDMASCYTNYWSGKLGSAELLGHQLRRGTIGGVSFVTVCSNDNPNSAPSAQNIITTDGSSRTRSSMQPYERLRNYLLNFDPPKAIHPVITSNIDEHRSVSSSSNSDYTSKSISINRRKKRIVASPPEIPFVPIRLDRRYSPEIVKKSSNRIMRGQNSWRRKIEQVVEKNNEQTNKRMKKLENDLSHARKELKNLRRSLRSSTVNNDVIAATPTAGTLIRLAANNLGGHCSTTEKVKRLVSEVLNEFNLTSLPDSIVQSHVKCVFAPWKIGKYKYLSVFYLYIPILKLYLVLKGKKMDENITGFNFGALDSMRKVQDLKKYEAGFICSGQTVRRKLTKLEDVMYSKGLTILNTTTESSVDPEALLRNMLKVFKIDELAKTSSILIALTGDGAELLRSGTGHVTVGYKMVDGRGINPYTNLPLSHGNGGYQSVDCCFPIMTVSEKESRELYEQKFKHIYEFFLSLQNGLPESNLGPKLHPFTLAAPHDGKAVLLLSGRGGGAKMANNFCFCPYCSCSSSQLIETFVETCLMCHTCIASGSVECRHWDVETDEKVTEMRRKYDILLQKNMQYCTTLSFRDNRSVKYLDVAHGTNDCGPNHLFFRYRDCNNIQSLRKFSNEIVANVRVRQQHGKMENVDTNIGSSREDMCRYLDDVVPQLTSLIAEEKQMCRLMNAISRYDKTHKNFLLPPDLLVIDVMHCLNRTVEKIITMILLQGVHEWVIKQKKTIHSFIDAVQEAVNTNDFWDVTENTPIRNKWEVPEPSKKEEYFGAIKLQFKKAKQFFKSLHLLYPICLPETNPMSERWKNAVEMFRHIMTVLQRHEDFTDEEIKQLQLDIDRFGALWISLANVEGIGNYFHYLIAGHVTYFLYRYRNLYKLCQQGWESLNGRMKNFHFRRTQMGGKGSKGFIFSPIYRCFLRRIGWAIDSIWRPIFDPMNSSATATDNDKMYEEIANIASIIENEDMNEDDEEVNVDIQE